MARLLKTMNIDNTSKSAILSVLIKPVSMVLGFLYTPLLLSYLGDEKYGLWATILSVISWVNFCDIGIGNGLRNILTSILSEKQFDKAKRVVSTAYICLTAIAAVIFAILCVLVGILDWNHIFSTDIEVKGPLLISFLFICINFILALCNTLLYSLQKAEIVSLQSVVVQLLNIVGILVLRAVSSENLVYMAILFGVSTMVVYICTTAKIVKENLYLRPNIRCYDRQYIKVINQLGLKFFIAQIAFVVLYTTDNLLVSKYFGPAQVTPFSLADKVFNIGYSVFSAFLVPFWSKTTQDLAQKNFTNIRSNFRRLNCLALVFCAGCILVAFIFRPVVNIWLGMDIAFSNKLIITMCIYYCIYSFCAVSSPILNGLGAVNGVMILGIMQGVANIPLSIFLATDGGFGIVGIRLATLVLVFLGAVFQWIYFHAVINRLQADEQKRFNCN